MESDMRITGRVKLEHFRNGRLIGQRQGKNLVMNVGRTLLTNIVRTNNGTYPTPEYIGFGSDGGGIDADAEDLGVELLTIPTGARTLVTTATLTLYDLTFFATVNKDFGAADTVREIAIFNAQPHGPASGVMLCRFLPQAFIMENGDSVLVVWVLTFGD